MRKIIQQTFSNLDSDAGQDKMMHEKAVDAEHGHNCNFGPDLGILQFDGFKESVVDQEANAGDPKEAQSDGHNFRREFNNVNMLLGDVPHQDKPGDDKVQERSGADAKDEPARNELL